MKTKQLLIISFILNIILVLGLVLVYRHTFSPTPVAEKPLNSKDKIEKLLATIANNNKKQVQNMIKSKAVKNLNDIKVHLDRNLLHFAVLVKSDEVIEVLIDAGVDMNHQDNQGYRPLDFVISQYFFFGFDPKKRSRAMVKTFIAKGVDVDYERPDGKTLLEIVRTPGNKEIEKAIQDRFDEQQQTN